MVKLTRRSTLADVTGTVAAALKGAGIAAVLTGGACATVYSNGAYRSHDIDCASMSRPPAGGALPRGTRSPSTNSSRNCDALAERRDRVA